MKLCFDSIDEVKSFVAQLKGTRGKKGEGEDETPTIAPPQAASALPAQTFAPPQQAMQGFPGATANAAPAANPLVAAIVGKIDQVIAGGQKPDDIANWFKTQIGPDAAQATLDQIKTIFIPRLAPEVLAKIAPQLGITG